MPNKIKISKKKLRELYRNNQLTTYEIAKVFGCCQATIWKRLNEFKINLRKPITRKANVPIKNFLKKQYIKNKLSTWEIEKRFGYSRGTIHKKLKEYGIDIRNRSKSHIRSYKKSFSNDLIEKAYLIGFRIGDLRVRKQYPNSEIIGVACGSTKPEQIKLIERLFLPYCKIWSKSNGNKANIEAGLDLSFSFLLSKELPRWVLDKKSHFFSFVAGFTDAEGWIGITSKNLAVYSLGNYEKDYLEFIKMGLEKFGIVTPKLICNKTKGKTDKNGYTKKGDYWSLRTSKKKIILQILENLKPHIKHQNKLKDLKKVEENIKERNLKYGNINM